MLSAQIAIHPEGWAFIVIAPIALLTGFAYGFRTPIQRARLIAYSLVVFVPLSLTAAASDWLNDTVVIGDWLSVGLAAYLAFCLALGSAMLFRRNHRGIGLCLVAGSLVPCGLWVVGLTS